MVILLYGGSGPTKKNGCSCGGQIINIQPPAIRTRKQNKHTAGSSPQCAAIDDLLSLIVLVWCPGFLEAFHCFIQSACLISDRFTSQLIDRLLYMPTYPVPTPYMSHICPAYKPDMSRIYPVSI